MADDTDRLVRRMIGGDKASHAQILECARTTTSAELLVAAALVTDQPAFLGRASQNATTTRDRQLVAIATAHLHDDADLLDALVRDHLSDHPDNLLVAWIAGRPTASS
jgi:hypothetical protein